MQYKDWIELYTSNIYNGSSGETRISEDIKRIFLNDCLNKRESNYFYDSTYINQHIFKNKIHKEYLNLRKEYSYKDLIEYINGVIPNQISIDSRRLFYDEDTILILSGLCAYEEEEYKDGKILFELYTKRENVYEEISKNIVKFFSPDGNLNEEVYTLTTTSYGLTLTSIGSFNKKLTESNYSDDVIDKFKSSIREINKKEPFGRLTILHGPPGTGKTYLLRSATNMVKDGLFIFIQPELFSRLSSMELIKVLSQYNHNKVILLVEDADSILIDRSKNNEDVVSQILNLTDGFMAEFLNLHIIATTNLPSLEIDEAYKRSGRLNKFIELTLLTTEEANRAYSKIKKAGKPDYIFNEPATLSDIYSIAMGNIEVCTKKRNKIGFMK